MSISRRDLLRLSAGSALSTLILSACRGDGIQGLADGLGGDDVSTGRLVVSTAHLPEPFTSRLTIPPVLSPASSDGLTDYHSITQRRATAQILPGVSTEIWGYEGLFPGPTIATRRGRRTVVRHRNELPVPTVVHLHGALTPADHDGYPTDLLLPDSGPLSTHANPDQHEAMGRHSHGSRDYIYPLDQPAATLWYHDHRMDFTGPQVYRGLAGFHLHTDDHEDNLPLPRGDHDLPLMICDRSFTADGSFAYPSLDPNLISRPGTRESYDRGVLGDVILVNGTPWPEHDVDNTRYRLRFLNASNARRYRLSLDPPPPEGAAFLQIGSDAGLLPAPVSHPSIDIAQGERYDVVVDFSRYPIGTLVTLSNGFGAATTRNVMRFHVTRRGRQHATVPSRLADTAPAEPPTATRQFVFDQRHDGWAINGATFDPDRDDVEPAAGSTELWHLDTDAHHPIHLHAAHFQILQRGGHPPGPSDTGWKDTVDVHTGQDVQLLVKFATAPGRYVFHCHNLEHEDMAMMANLRIS
jgi:spore coat protein A, manganese oxidase